MRYALMIEPQQGISWQEHVALVHHAEDGGFETLYRSDHYESFPGPAGGPSNDALTSIAGLVRESSRIRHGTLVSPVTFRQPAHVAKSVTTIDEMSGGRIDLGLGAGWHRDEHRRHGFPFPDLPTRLEMLEEQLQIVAGLWSGVPGWSFEGKHYRIEDARFAPGPVQQPRVPLIVGTKGKARAVGMAARWADHLNLFECDPVVSRRAFELLDEECRRLGRDPSEVTRSVLLPAAVGDGVSEAARRRDQIIETFDYGDSPEEWSRENEGIWLQGDAAVARELVGAFEAAGADVIVFQDFLPHDLGYVDQLAAYAREWA